MRAFAIGGLAAVLAWACVEDASPGGDPSDAGVAPGLGACTRAADEGAPCADVDQCVDGLRCIEGACRLQSLEGEPCRSGGDCADGLYCEEYTLRGQQLPSPVCRPEQSAGEGCFRRNYSCASRLYCIGGACRPESSRDEPCEGILDCERDLYCRRVDDDGVPSSGRCRPEAAAGEPCDPAGDGCASGLACIEGTCAPGRVDGEPCEDESHCVIDHYCDRYDDDGRPRGVFVCRPEPPVGAPCDARERSMCRDGACVAGTCRDDAPEGAACTSDSVCGRNLYCRRE